MSKKMAFFGMTAAVGLVVSASSPTHNVNDPVEFPDLQGDGDLSADASWGAGGVPAEKCPFITKAGDYYIKRAVTFGGFGVKGFPNGGIATVTAAGQSVTMAGHLDFVQDHSVTFAGGIWDFQGKYASCWGDWNEPQPKNVHITLDGCVFTNMPDLVTGYYSGAGFAVWTLQNNAGIYVNNNLWLGYLDGGSNQINVISGSRFVTGDDTRFPSSEGAPNSALKVSGQGSFFKAGNGFVFGAGSRNNRLTAEDGASADVGGGWWYYMGANNEICAEGEGTTLQLGPLQGVENSVSNRIVIMNGAALTTGTMALGKAQDFGLIISNATATFSSGTVFEGVESTDCYVHMMGESASLSVPPGFRFGGEGLDVLVSEGTHTAIGDGYMYLTGNKVAIRAKGLGTTVSVCASYLSGASDRFEVADHAVMTMEKIYSGGTPSNVGLVVSNGTLNLRGTDLIADSYMRVSGSCPVVNVGDMALPLRQNYKLIFDLPLEGYADGNRAPIEFSTWTSGDETGSIEIANVEEVKEYLRLHGLRSRTWKILCAPYGIDGVTVESLGRNLPEDCTLSYQDGTYSVTIKVHYGMSLILR